ncbi:prepilin-type N-terminal cleavage/methylation domain-containing protein [Aciditerrimonas ferrireducens]|uniref:Prepilin-type N-terminal cleavage/methylation domain-containing protein n=1 Tax=Aciditerrimonas ferrireducens TaxID=667306 RepID=A0ABV6C0M5_9ACTN
MGRRLPSLRNEGVGAGCGRARRRIAPGAPGRAADGRTEPTEAGFSLVEVVVAVVVLLVVLVPVGSLLAISDQVTSTGRFRATAEQLAASDLSAVELEAAEHPGVLPPFSGVPGLPVAVASPTGSPPAWNTTQPALLTTEGTEQYRQWVDGSWCDEAPTTSSGTAGQLASVGQGPPVFLVVVKVVWGPSGADLGVTAPSTSSVVSAQVLAPQPAWPPTSGQATSECPADLG